MKKSLTAVAALLMVSGSALAATPASCVKVDQQQIEALFDKWNAALKTGNAKQVSDLYLEDAVLLPTVSNRVRLTEAERIDYFAHFMANKPSGKIDSRTIRIGCNKAVDTGTYTFTYADKPAVSARYTFTYAWTGSEWKISTHHSSAMPEG
ncbi:MAG: SgcJ/EcaC family oxidoreductase [Pantoea sp.]|uniref:DUF4440 domain-containing protein n=1 Tax=Pantoea phytobeneficialis TaxID=2052056 RepID=A0AAP9KRM0_9GAMM|nr:SgcJ/EcaC family oxidoreductase [Pantoea phytobeneficialis]MDO6406722.1 SgcJ/EcaC family oxidoreductase [Pantoea phytobeneficialis]QGR09251.1 DUF4440 domain-containing protein [Pantoea phytobeneficialis]